MSLDEDRADPPHFHEFTVRELAEAARRGGWHVAGVETHNGFSRNNLLSDVYNRVCSVLPESFGAGISDDPGQASAVDQGRNPPGTSQATVRELTTSAGQETQD